MGLSQPNFDDSGESDALHLDEKSDIMSLVSESDACSISDFVTKPVTKNKKYEMKLVCYLKNVRKRNNDFLQIC